MSSFSYRLLLYAGLLLLFTACSEEQAASRPTAVVETTTPAETIITTELTPMPEETPADATAEPSAGESITDEEARQLLDELLAPGDGRAALERIAAAEDERFVSVLLELFRARQIGLVQHLSFGDIIDHLEALSGQAFGDDWAAWIEWYGSTDLEPPPGFTGWKGEVLAGIDPRFADFLQEEDPSRIRVEEIQWGGVVVDGIPALDNPTMIAPEAADYLEPWDPVFGLEINGDTRAYPLRILDWHEMANDVIGGVPVSLAYCTLCGAAIAYDGRSVDASGEDITYTFGSSGFLFRSNKLMYDRQTRTLWNQLTGEPVLGELAAADIRLGLLPVVLTTWADWQEQHPDTVVVDEETGFRRPYEPGAAYGNYFAFEGTMFPVWQRSDARATKDWVYALNIDETPKAYPLESLIAEQVVNDTLAGTDVVLIAPNDLLEVEGNNQYVGPVTYTAGGTVRAYDRGDHRFKPHPDATDRVLDENGNVWTVTEAALVGPDDEMAPRRNGHLAYWFGWYAFYPDTLVYEP